MKSLKGLWKEAGASRREFAIFILVGGANTLITYGLYLGLLLVARYQVAYSGSYLMGIFISYVLNAAFVFKEPLRLAKALQYPVVYVAQYLLGLGCLYFLIEVIHLSKVVAPLAAVLVTVPCTFLLSRYVIRGRNRPADKS